MNTQPKALQLADLLLERERDIVDFLSEKAAAELRRLHKVNQMLVEALDWIGTVYARDYEYQEKANAALAKAKEQA
jgi:hypothetical protein